MSKVGTENDASSPMLLLYCFPFFFMFYEGCPPSKVLNRTFPAPAKPVSGDVQEEKTAAQWAASIYSVLKIAVLKSSLVTTIRSLHPPHHGLNLAIQLEILWPREVVLSYGSVSCHVSFSWECKRYY